MKPFLRRAFVGLVGALGAVFLLVSARLDRSWFEMHFLRLRCTLDPSELRVMTTWRIAFGLAGIALFLLIRPLNRWLVREGAGGNLLRILAALVSALVVSEVVLRFWSRAGVAPPLTIGVPPTHPDPHLGWAYDGPRTSVLVGV